MTILGKVLLFFNIVAGGAVAYFASQAWTERQTQNATALKFYLYLYGLPAVSDALPAGPKDDDPVPLGTEAAPYRMGPSHSVRSVRAAYLRKHFENTDKGEFAKGAPAPNSRQGELTRVRGAVEKYVENLPGDADRLAFLVGKYAGLKFEPGLLVQLADGFEEREAFRSLIQRPSEPEAFTEGRVAENAATARKALAGKLDAVLNTPNPALLADDTAKLQAAAKVLAAADDEVKAANEKYKAASKAYRDKYDPLLANSAEANFTNDDAAYEEVKKLRADRDAAYEAVLKKYEAKLAAERALMAQRAVTRTAATDEPDRLRRGIQLMMSLDRTDSWQRRVVLVFGLGDYLAALKDRVERHAGQRPYVPRLGQTLESETAAFNGGYERAKEIAIDRDRLLYRQTEITEALKRQLKSTEDQLAAAKAQYEARSNELKAVEGEVANRIATQNQVEADLFGVQKQIGDLLRTNFEMEAKLADVERKLAAGK